MNRTNLNGSMDIRSPIPPVYPSPSMHLSAISSSSTVTNLPYRSSSSTSSFPMTSTTVSSTSTVPLQSPQFSNHAPLEFSRLQRSTAFTDSPSGTLSSTYPGNNSRYTQSVLPTPSTGTPFSSPQLRQMNHANSTNVPTIRTPELPQDLQRTADAYRRGLHTVQLPGLSSPSYAPSSSSSSVRLASTTTTTSPFPTKGIINSSTITSPQASTYLRSTFSPTFSSNIRENIPLRDDIPSSSSASSRSSSSVLPTPNPSSSSNNHDTLHHRLPLPDTNPLINNDPQSYFVRNKQGQVQVFSPLSSTHPASSSSTSSVSSSLPSSSYRGPRVEIIQTVADPHASDKPSHAHERSTSLTLSAAPQQYLWSNSPRVSAPSEKKDEAPATSSSSSFAHSTKLSRGTLQTVFDNLIDGLLDDGSSVSPSHASNPTPTTKSYPLPQTSLSSTVSSFGSTLPNRVDIDLLPSSASLNKYNNDGQSLFDMLQMDLEVQTKSQYSSPVKQPSPEKQTTTMNRMEEEGNSDVTIETTEGMYANLPLFGSPEPVMPIPSTSTISSNVLNTNTSPPRRPPFILGTTLYDFIGIEDQGELSFTKGKEIMINHWEHHEWWHGSIVGDNQRKKGWFPRTYVKLLQDIPEHWANASTSKNQDQRSASMDAYSTVNDPIAAVREDVAENIESEAMVKNTDNQNTTTNNGSDSVGLFTLPTAEIRTDPQTNHATENITIEHQQQHHPSHHVSSESRSSIDSYSTADEVDINNVLLSPNNAQGEGRNAPIENGPSPTTTVSSHADTLSTKTNDTHPSSESSSCTTTEPIPIQTLDPTFVSPRSTLRHQPNVLNPIAEEDGETSTGPTPLTRSRAGTSTNVEDDLLSIDNQTRHLETALATALQSAITGIEEKSDGVPESETVINHEGTITHSTPIVSSFSGTAHLPSEVLSALSMARSPSGNIVFTNSTVRDNDTPSDNENKDTVPVRPTKTVSFKLEDPANANHDNHAPVTGTVSSSSSTTYVPLPVVKLLLNLNSMGMLPTKENIHTATTTSITSSDLKDTSTPPENKHSVTIPSFHSPRSIKFEAEDILDLVKAVQGSMELSTRTPPTNTASPLIAGTISPSSSFTDSTILLDKEVNAIIKRIAQRTVNEQISLSRSSSGTGTNPSSSPFQSTAISNDASPAFPPPSILLPTPSLPYTFSNSALRYENGVTPGTRTPHTIQLLTIADGRRIKLVGLTGPELVYLVRPKVYALGFMVRYTKFMLRQKRLRAIRALSIFLRWKNCILQRRRVTKLYTLGLMKNFARWRLIEQVSPRIATLGVLLRPMRDKHEAMKKRAQVASKNSAILAGLEKGVSMEETLREPYDGPRTRGIHWEAMNADSVRGTIWDKSTHTTLGNNSSGRPSSIHLSSNDVQQLLPDLFAKFSAEASTNNKIGTKKIDTPQKGSQSSSAATPGKSTLVSVLNAEVGRLLAISVGAVIGRRSLQEIREAIYKLDIETLGGIEKVQLLANNTVLFDNEKLGPLLNFTGNIDTLVLPERFVKVVLQGVQGFRMRLNVMEFMALLPELSSSCTIKLQLLIDSVKEIMHSRRFATLLLDVILPLGNKLNAGSKGRIAAGFKISSLHKLVQTRAATGETFLQFVVAGLLTRSPTVLDLASDFSHLLTATPAALSRERVTSDLSRLEQGIRQIEALLNLTRTQKETENTHRLQPLLDQTKQTVQEIKSLANESVRLFDELARWLGEDPSKTTPETILGYIQSFIAAVAKDTRDVKEKLERAAKAELRKQQMEQQQQANVQRQQQRGGTDRGHATKNSNNKSNYNHTNVSSNKPTETFGPLPRPLTRPSTTAASSPPQSPNDHKDSSPNRPLPPSRQRRGTNVSPPSLSPRNDGEGDKTIPLHTRAGRKIPPPPQGMHRSPSQKQLDQINAAIQALQSNADEKERSRNGPVSPPLSRANSSLSTLSPNTKSQSSGGEEFFVPHKNKLHHPTQGSSPPLSRSSTSDSLPSSPGGFMDHSVSRSSSSLSAHPSAGNRSSSSLSSPNSVLTAGPIAVGHILDESSKRRSGRSVQSLAEYAQSILGSNNVSSALSSPVEVSRTASIPSGVPSSTTTVVELSPHKDTTVPALPTGRRLSLVMTQAKLSRYTDHTLPDIDNSNAIELSLTNGNVSPRATAGPSRPTVKSTDSRGNR